MTFTRFEGEEGRGITGWKLTLSRNSIVHSFPLTPYSTIPWAWTRVIQSVTNTVMDWINLVPDLVSTMNYRKCPKATNRLSVTNRRVFFFIFEIKPFVFLSFFFLLSFFLSFFYSFCGKVTDLESSNRFCHRSKSSDDWGSDS